MSDMSHIKVDVKVWLKILKVENSVIASCLYDLKKLGSMRPAGLYLYRLLLSYIIGIVVLNRP